MILLRYDRTILCRWKARLYLVRVARPKYPSQLQWYVTVCCNTAILIACSCWLCPVCYGVGTNSLLRAIVVRARQGKAAQWACNNGWVTPRAGILGFAQWFKSSYIAYGQNTEYEVGIDVTHAPLYNHRYAINIADSWIKGVCLSCAHPATYLSDSS